MGIKRTRARAARVVTAAVVGVVAIVAPAAGQPSTDTGTPPSPTEVQVHLQQMEAALERAVEAGVRAVEQQLPAPTPGLVFFVGPIRARGFRLDGYGLFFDVEYPVVRRSVLWSMGLLRELDLRMSEALVEVRRRVQAMHDQGGPAGEPVARPTTEAPGEVPALGSGPPAVDLEEMYVAALTGALTDALVTFGNGLPLAHDEWLTIAARDGREAFGRARAMPRRTLQLRIRGRDLAAIRDEALSVEDARARVEAIQD